MSEKLNQVGTLHHTGPCVGRDQDVAQESKNIIELKQRVLGELENPGFPDLEFLFSNEILPIVGEIFDEILQRYNLEFENLYSMSNSEIKFEDIPNFDELYYVYNLISHVANTRGAEVSEKLFSEVSKKIGNFCASVNQSQRYYEIICYVLEQGDVSFEQRRVLEIDRIACEKSGVHLSNIIKQELIPVRERLNMLASQFMENVKESRRKTSFVIPEEYLGDMPEHLRALAYEEGKTRGNQGYVFVFTPANEGALLRYVTDEATRKEIYYASLNIAHEKNTDIVLEMIALRKQYAQIGGYESYADFAIQGKMATGKEQISDLYTQRIKTYRESLEDDIQEMCEYYGIGDMNIWDFSYYKSKYISETQNIAPSDIQPYLEYQNVLKGVFQVIEKVFGVKFKETDIQTYDEKVKVFLVSKDGKKLGYYMPDLFTHPGKRQGGWAEALKKSTKGEKIMTNVGNIASVEGKQYFSFLDIRVIFHELGHMVHELLSPQSDTRLSGFEVESDAIEIPSMFFENLSVPYELAREYLRHEETGEEIPEKIFNAFSKEITFCSDYGKLRSLYHALFDLEIHSDTIPTSTSEIQNIFQRYSSQALPLQLGDSENNNVASSFHHLFHSATGMYVAGYYSYAWSEEMQSQIWDKVMQTGGPLQSPIIQRYIDFMLSQGARKPSQAMYQQVIAE